MEINILSSWGPTGYVRQSGHGFQLTIIRSKVWEHPEARRIRFGLWWVIVSLAFRHCANPSQSQKYGVNNTYSDYTSILTYDQNGFSNYSNLLDEFSNDYTPFQDLAGTILVNNLQDLSARAGLTRSAWTPKKDMKAQAVEWWNWGAYFRGTLDRILTWLDFEYGYSPDLSSLVFGIANYVCLTGQFRSQD